MNPGFTLVAAMCLATVACAEAGGMDMEASARGASVAPSAQTAEPLAPVEEPPIPDVALSQTGDSEDSTGPGTSIPSGPVGGSVGAPVPIDAGPVPDPSMGTSEAAGEMPGASLDPVGDPEGETDTAMSTPDAASPEPDPPMPVLLGDGGIGFAADGGVAEGATHNVEEPTSRLAADCCIGAGCALAQPLSCDGMDAGQYLSGLIAGASGPGFAGCCSAGEKCGVTAMRCGAGQRCVFNADGVNLDLSGYVCEAGSTCDAYNRASNLTGLRCADGAVCRFHTDGGLLSGILCEPGSLCSFQCKGRDCQNITVQAGATGLFDCSGAHCANLQCEAGATCLADCTSVNAGGCIRCAEGAACACYGGPCNSSVCSDPPCSNGLGHPYLEACWAL